jgi:hypothetical protein
MSALSYVDRHVKDRLDPGLLALIRQTQVLALPVLFIAPNDWKKKVAYACIFQICWHMPPFRMGADGFRPRDRRGGAPLVVAGTDDAQASLADLASALLSLHA